MSLVAKIFKDTQITKHLRFDEGFYGDLKVKLLTK